MLFHPPNRRHKHKAVFGIAAMGRSAHFRGLATAVSRGTLSAPLYELVQTCVSLCHMRGVKRQGFLHLWKIYVQFPVFQNPHFP